MGWMRSPVHELLISNAWEPEKIQEQLERPVPCPALAAAALPWGQPRLHLLKGAPASSRKGPKLFPLSRKTLSKPELFLSALPGLATHRQL